MAFMLSHSPFADFQHAPSVRLRVPDEDDELPRPLAIEAPDPVAAHDDAALRRSRAADAALRRRDEGTLAPDTGTKHGSLEAGTAKAKKTKAAAKKRSATPAKTPQEPDELQAPLVVVADERPMRLFDAPEPAPKQKLPDNLASKAVEPTADEAMARPPNDEERVIIISSWEHMKKKGLREQEDNQEGVETHRQVATKQRKGGLAGRLFGKGNAQGDVEQEDADVPKQSQTSGVKIPQTFEEMAVMNARLIGANVSWVQIVLDSFDLLMSSVIEGDEMMLEQRCAVIALRLHKADVGAVNLDEFKVCMMASLRALLLQRWNDRHECAWLCLWSYIQDHMRPSLPLPMKYEKLVCALVAKLDQPQKDEIGLAVFNRLFQEVPAAERLFNQSNARLSFIVRSAIEMCPALFENPTAAEQYLIGLGLRHIMYKTGTEFFATFVTCCTEELAARFQEPLAIEGFNWALSVVASVMVFAISRGSTPIVVAAVSNDVKGLKKALGDVSREKRANECLYA